MFYLLNTVLLRRQLEIKSKAVDKQLMNIEYNMNT